MQDTFILTFLYTLSKPLKRVSILWERFSQQFRQDTELLQVFRAWGNTKMKMEGFSYVERKETDTERD